MSDPLKELAWAAYVMGTADCCGLDGSATDFEHWWKVQQHKSPDWRALVDAAPLLSRSDYDEVRVGRWLDDEHGPEKISREDAEAMGLALLAYARAK